MRDFYYRPGARFTPRANKHRHPTLRSRAVVCVCAILGAALAVPAAAVEKPANIIAAHIRNQGYACHNALSARRNWWASRPNQAVWVLRCNNAAYRVRLVPDMAATVERIK
jgi:hypothetical protein